MDRQSRIDARPLCRHFDRAAATFDTADFVHSMTRDGLMERLEPVVLDATRILDLGCATGKAIPLLEKRFRRARVTGVDLSTKMLEVARKRGGWFSRSAVLCADACQLPVEDHSIDLVFANLLMPWIDDPSALGREVCRVLRKDGLFVFSSLGPDSLQSLRRAWASVDEFEHVLQFPDMHDVGDALVNSGLRDPVVDVDRLSVTYESPDKLFGDLTAAGARNALTRRRPTLTGAGRIAAVREKLRLESGGLPINVDLELVYGHCWGRGEVPRRGEVRIDPGSISMRRRSPS